MLWEATTVVLRFEHCLLSFLGYRLGPQLALLGTGEKHFDFSYFAVLGNHSRATSAASLRPSQDGNLLRMGTFPGWEPSWDGLLVTGSSPQRRWCDCFPLLLLSFPSWESAFAVPHTHDVWPKQQSQHILDYNCQNCGPG